MFLFICRIAFHPAMVAHVSLNLFENKVQVLTVLGTDLASVDATAELELPVCLQTKQLHW